MEVIYMRNCKKTLAVILASLMLLGSTACSNNSNDSDKTDNNNGNSSSVDNNNNESETEETRQYLDNLPEDLKFDNLTVRFLVSDSTSSIALLEEDDESDIVNEAVWRRNLKMEERLGLKVEIATGAKTGYGEFNSTVKNSVTAGSDDYDILVGHTRFNINLAAEGILKNLNKVNNIDLDQSYWSKSYNDNISYNDIHYWATGDLALDYIKDIYSMFVNSSMWNDHFSDVNIYDIVKEGKWTLDTLNTYATDSYVDENGNGEVDNSDSFGVIMQQGHVLNGMFFASGVEYTAYDESGKPYVVLNSEHTIDVFNKLHSLFYDTSYGRMLGNSDFDTLSVDMFTTRRLLFCPNTFVFAENEKIRNMDDDFFIIPMPKFDENQENYRSGQYDGVPIYGIIITANEANMDAFGAALEAMCSMSSTMVLPTYYDKALKNKYSRDAETAEMIDIVHDSVASDFSFAWGDTVGSIYNNFYDNIASDQIASKLKSYGQEVWKSSLLNSTNTPKTDDLISAKNIAGDREKLYFRLLFSPSYTKSYDI